MLLDDKKVIFKMVMTLIRGVSEAQGAARCGQVQVRPSIEEMSNDIFETVDMQA